MRHLVARAVVVAAAFALCLVGAGASAAGDDAAWSEAVHGLRARLTMRRAYVSNGTGMVVTHLELNNVGEVCTPMLVAVNRQSVTYSVTDADDRDVRMYSGPFSGPVV